MSNYRVNIPDKYENMKDDNHRLELHTRQIVEELGQMVNTWTKEGLDSRAIYAALAVYHTYMYQLGFDRLGVRYMSALEDQGAKLAEELLKRR